MGAAAAIGVSVAAPIIGGIIGDMASAGDRDRASRAAQDAFNIINSIGAPPDLSKKILLDKFKEAGVYTPELEQKIDVGISKVSQIQEKPELAQAQMSALQALQQRSRTGISPEDRAALNQVRAEIQRDQEAKRQQIIQNMQARGLGGGGAEIAAQLAAQQGTANQASMAGEQLAGQASQRALEALRQSGAMAGDIRGQEFDIARTKAAAEDELRRFDLANQMAMQSRNISAKNAAALSNLQNQQQIANANIAMENQERMRQNEAQRQYWQDQLARAGALSGAKQAESAYYGGQAERTANKYGQIGSAIGKGIGAYGDYQQMQGLQQRADARNDKLVSAMSTPQIQFGPAQSSTYGDFGSLDYQTASRAPASSTVRSSSNIPDYLLSNEEYNKKYGR